MPPTDLSLAQLVATTYTNNPTGLILDANPDRAVLTQTENTSVVAIRGTANITGWWSDFQIQPRTSRHHPQLGTCEDGFLTGAEQLWQLIQPHLPAGPVILAGHSRGAAIVPILAGLMLLANTPPIRCVCFEKPWCCNQVLSTLISNIPGIEYWNGNDPVPAEPNVPWLVGNVWPISNIGAARLIDIECHFMDNVLAALPAIP